MPADEQRAGGGELAGAGQLHDVGAAARALPLQLGLGENLLDDRRCVSHAGSVRERVVSHGRAVAGGGAPALPRCRRRRWPRRRCPSRRPARAGRRRAQRAPSAGSVDEMAQHAGVVARVVAGDQEAGRRSAHGDGQAADRGREHRRAARLRLDGDQPEGLAVRGHDQHGRGPEPVRELAPGRPAAGTARRRRCRAARRASAALRAWRGRCRWDRRRPGRRGGRAARGRSSSRTATARSSTSGAFRGCMRPAKSGITASCGRPRRARAAARPSAGAEAVEVDARVDDGDLAGVGVVVA